MQGTVQNTASAEAATKDEVADFSPLASQTQVVEYLEEESNTGCYQNCRKTALRIIFRV